MKFLFDPEAGEDYVKDLQLKRDAVNERINVLSKRTLEHTKGMDVIQGLINLTDGDPKSLMILGKALQRVAEIIPELTDVEDKLKIVEGIRDNQSLVSSIFGDFTEDVNRFTEHFAKDTLDDQ